MPADAAYTFSDESQPSGTSRGGELLVRQIAFGFERAFRLGVEQPGREWRSRVVCYGLARLRRLTTALAHEALTEFEERVVDWLEAGAKRGDQMPCPAEARPIGITLLKILQRSIAEFFRKMKRRERHHPKVRDRQRERLLGTLSLSPSVSASDREEARHIEEGIGKLLGVIPEPDRTILVFVVVEDWRLKEVAEILALSLRQVQASIKRTKRRLAKIQSETPFLPRELTSSK
jgi:RNA polymerase sigma factor (sigma-70 family)